jgi:hypothetical protein
MRLPVAAPFALVALLVATVVGRAGDGDLPRFTEEREAAALFFVKKNLPELLPPLEGLKKNNNAQYRREIREIFQVTELLADIEDEKRHDLELRIWKTENRALRLVAQLSTPKEEERKKVETAIQDLARELVDLDIAVLELKAEQLEKELTETRDELSKMRDGADKHARERYRLLVEKANRPKK